MNRTLHIVLGLLIAARATATPLLLSDFATADTGSGTAKDASFEFIEPTADANAYVCFQNSPSGCQVHKAVAGGSDSVYTALAVDVGSGASGYYSLRTLLDKSQVSVAFNLHLPSAPGIARKILELREDDGAGGTQQSVYLTLNTDLTVTLNYRGGVTVGTTAEKVEQRVCCDSGTSTCYSRLECAADGDCATGQQCGSGGSKVCDATTGAGCYHVGGEVTVNVTSPTNVGLDLRMDGRLAVTTVLTTTGARNIKDVWIGASGAEAGTFKGYYSGLAIDDSSRAGYGYVAVSTPSADGTIHDWTRLSCGAGTAHFSCVKDFDAGGSYASTSRLQVTSKNRTDQNAALAPALVVRSGETISALELLLLGFMSNAGGGTLHLTTTLCSGVVCAALRSLALPQDTADLLWDRHVYASAPTAGGTVAWSVGTAQAAHFTVATDTTVSVPTSNLTAALVYTRVVKPDEPAPILLTSRNKGTDHGYVVIAGVGDSTAGDTLAGFCPDGRLCTYQDACEGGAWVDTKDKPVGGCNGDNSVCVTCTGRREETATGSGYKCEDNTQCGDNAATCTGGVCSQNANVPCASASDCFVSALGVCDVAAACVDSCPTGDCPERVSWPAYIRSSADVLLRCGKGAETTWELATNRAPNIIAGMESSCIVEFAAAGIDIPCMCTVSKDCGACSGNPTRSCSNDGDCAGVGTCTTGTCTGGVCTAGVTSRTVCRDPTADCALNGITPFACKVPAPSHVVPHEGYNDVGFTGGPSPTCSGSSSVLNSSAFSPCGYCPFRTCTADSGCAADPDGGGPLLASAESQCGGVSTSLGLGFGCWDGSCTTFTKPCRTTVMTKHGVGGCPAGLTCSQEDDSDWLANGFCLCTTSADCDVSAPGNGTAAAPGFECVGDTGGKLCRRSCGRCSGDANYRCGVDADCSAVGKGTCNSSVNGDCGGSNTCTSSTPRVCSGQCTCPSKSRPCTTTADCTTPVNTSNGVQFVYRGDCVSGHCECAGPDTCRTDTRYCPGKFADWYKPTQDNFAARQFHAFQAIIEALPETDGRPLLIPTTIPEVDTRECYDKYPHQGYYGKVSGHIKNEFSIVADFRAAYSRYSPDVYSTDSVHKNAFGGALGGAVVTQTLDSVGTCWALDSIGLRAPKKYCKNNDGTWATTVCTSSANCTTTQTCQIKRCGCSCFVGTAGDRNCANWFGVGHTCVSGICKKSGTDSCDVVDGGSAGSSSCSSGMCTGACPGGGTCAAEPS